MLYYTEKHDVTAVDNRISPFLKRWAGCFYFLACSNISLHHLSDNIEYIWFISSCYIRHLKHLASWYIITNLYTMQLLLSAKTYMYSNIKWNKHVRWWANMITFLSWNKKSCVWPHKLYIHNMKQPTYDHLTIT